MFNWSQNYERLIEACDSLKLTLASLSRHQLGGLLLHAAGVVVWTIYKKSVLLHHGRLKKEVQIIRDGIPSSIGANFIY